MFPPNLYYKLYIVVIAIITIICIYNYSQLPPSRVNSNEQVPIKNYGPSLILALCVTLFIGLRPLSVVFADMINYEQGYEAVSYTLSSFEASEEDLNFIFNNLLILMAVSGFSSSIFFLIIALIYFGCMLWALRKMFPNDTFYSFVIYLGAFSTFSYGTNGLKAGAAASIFLLAFAYYKKPLFAALFCFISFGFHHSMILPIYGFIAAYFIRNSKWFYLGWVICLILSFAHIGGITDFLSQFADEQDVDRYLSQNDSKWGGRMGFRWDFVLYSIVPMVIGLLTLYKWRLNDRLYQLLLNTYIFVNGLWMLCMYIPFNNRIAYLSWLLLPVVSVYPYFKFKINSKQYLYLNYVASLYILFTLTMVFM